MDQSAEDQPRAGICPVLMLPPGVWHMDETEAQVKISFGQTTNFTVNYRLDQS